jgi:hypothetical protein
MNDEQNKQPRTRRSNKSMDDGMMPRMITGIQILLLLMICFPQTVGATQGPVDHRIYGKLLKAHVSQGRVDYNGFKKDEAQLDTYLAALATIDPGTLSKQEQMAFYINAYNAWTIKLILDAWPDLNSIKDLGGLFQSPWKKSFVKLWRGVVTLDHIEHDILRPRYKDPRIHFAINCASISCPLLLNVPYTGSELDRQLDRVTADFINDPNNNYISGNALHVSKIFKWFNEDFNGDTYGFIKRYARADLKKQLDSRGEDLKIKYLHYDWGLNNV